MLLLHKCPWYAICVRSRFENVTSRALEKHGYSTYVPFYAISRHGSGRSKAVKFPLFPGYIFCRIDLNACLPVLTAPGVRHIVGAGPQPRAIPDDQIHAIQAIAASGQSYEPCRYQTKGQRVRVISGPMRSVEGIVIHDKSQSRLIISIPLLQRSVAVDIDRFCLKPIASATAD